VAQDIVGLADVLILVVAADTFGKTAALTDTVAAPMQSTSDVSVCCLWQQIRLRRRETLPFLIIRSFSIPILPVRGGSGGSLEVVGIAIVLVHLNVTGDGETPL
jgi:hypothetical protein